MEMGVVIKLCAPLNSNFNMEDDDTLLHYWGDAYGSNILDPDAAHLVIYFFLCGTYPNHFWGTQFCPTPIYFLT